MNRRRIAVVVAVGISAAVVVGLSAAATMSARTDSPKPAKATKAATPAKASVSQADIVVSSPKSQQQTPDEVASFWTKERMHNARPMGKTVPGGSQSSSPSPSLQGSPAGTSSTSAPAKKRPQSKRASQTSGVTSSPDTAGNAADYWTQDQMDKAQPMDKTVPGGDGSEQGSPAPPLGGAPAGIP